MGSESIAHEAERNNCFSKIQLVGEKYRRDKKTLASKTRFSRHCFSFHSLRVAAPSPQRRKNGERERYSLVLAQPIITQH